MCLVCRRYASLRAGLPLGSVSVPALEDPGSRCPLPPYVKLSLADPDEALPSRRHVCCRERASDYGDGVLERGSAGDRKRGWSRGMAASEWGRRFDQPQEGEALAVILAVKHLAADDWHEASARTVSVTQVLTTTAVTGTH